MSIPTSLLAPKTPNSLILLLKKEKKIFNIKYPSGINMVRFCFCSYKVLAGSKFPTSLEAS